jgi:hypothetical protein
MDDSKAKVPDRFFVRVRWQPLVAGILAGSYGLLALGNVRRGDAFHLLSTWVQFAAVGIWGWLGWHWWRDRQHPLVTVSDEAIEWWVGSPRQGTRVLMHDVLELLPPVGPSATPLGLRTRSHGTMWLSLDRLSVPNRRQVCRAIETRLIPASDGSEPRL